jgi:EAL domain-containing protein (putative c-di-GMP-specific phosphodiesterase class I)
MTDPAAERAELAKELRLALARREVQAHFQPQVALASGRIVGAEALVRWQHRERGWIPPARFLPIAVESNLIHPLGELVLAQGCRQVKAWERAGLPSLRVAINVSPRQFGSAGFVRSVEGALRVAALDPGRMQLELTQALLREDRERAIAVLRQLKALGVLIAIDDFGADRFSLDDLRQLPVDCLKIDRSVVQRITEEGEDTAIALGVISRAQGLGLNVIAAGVETLEQLDFLLSQGCEEGQGKLFCEPLPADALGPLLAAGRVSLAREMS